jgi:hypothetical protein
MHKPIPLVLMVALAGCAVLKSIAHDPRGDMKVTGWRVPAGAPGASCAASCNNGFMSCQSLEGGDTVSSDLAERCNADAIACYEGCPGVTVGEGPQGVPANVNNGREACSQGLDADAFYCFAYFPGTSNFIGFVYDP